MEKEENTAHFELVKRKNRKIIRNILRKENPIGISKLSKMSGLCYPTVASLLKELQQEGQVLISDKTESNGGRPGVRYEFASSYQYAFVLILWDQDMIFQIYDAAGKMVENFHKDFNRKIQVDDICQLIREQKNRYNSVSAIAFGIPGTVFQDTITHLPKAPGLIGSELAKRLKEEFHTDLYIENDINSISYDEIELMNMNDFAHVVFMERCIGVGIVLNGEVVKGTRGFAGEFQYLVNNEKDTAQVLAECILILISVLDLEDFVISSDSATEDTPEQIMQILKGILPEARLPKLHAVDYHLIDDRYADGLIRRIVKHWEEQE